MEGKELLLKCLNEIKKSQLSYKSEDLKVDGKNLYELLIELVDDISNFAYVSDKIIKYVLNESGISNAPYERDLLEARDLLLGKKEYNLKITLSDNYQTKLTKFQEQLCSLLDTLYPGIIDSENTKFKVKTLEDAINLNRLIIDFEFIESIVSNYDLIEFDNNMLNIMTYINKHNLNVMKIKRKNAPQFDIELIKKPKLDDYVLEILDKVGVLIDDLPNYLLSELKKANPKKIYKTFSLMKKNMAEKGGIMHLISKNNILCKLVILLYSSDEVILDIIKQITPSDEVVNINILKTLLNEVPSIFIEKNNDYFKPKYEDFKNNIELLKKYEINYPALIELCPLFFMMDNSIIEYTLDYLNKCGANEKKIINKCYKVLANDPSLLISNANILKKYSINLLDYFSNNENYSLLKVENLDSILDKMIKDKGEVVLGNFDLMNKLLIMYIKKGDVND